MTGREDASHDLIGAYALGALDELESTRFERHLEECASCQAELAELREATSALALAHAEQPPARLREDVLKGIDETLQEGGESQPRSGMPGTTTAERPATARQRLARNAKRFTLVAAALLAAALVTLNLLPPRQDPLDEVRAAALEGNAGEVSRLLEEFGDELDLQDVVTDMGVSARLVRSNDDAVLITDGLPELAGDQTYQLWLIEEAGPRSSGLLGPAADPVGDIGELDEDVQAVAVSVEPAGGSEQPSEQIVLSIPTA